MSFKNPTYREILENSSSSDEYLRSHFGKSYHYLACRDFFKKHGRKPNIEDSQEVYNLFESEWQDILTPEYEEERREFHKKFCRKMGYI